MHSPIRRSTAHHEAGHAVLAHRLGAKVERIAFDTSSDIEGRTDITPKCLPLETRLLISLAGPLAEAKYEAANAANCEVRFNLTRIEGILSAACEDDYLDGANPVIHFEAGSRGAIEFCPKDTNLFSDLESICESEELSETDKEQFGQLVCQTMTYLDEAETWRSVQLVAEELLAVSSDSGERFVELMGSVKRQ